MLMGIKTVIYRTREGVFSRLGLRIDETTRVSRRRTTFYILFIPVFYVDKYEAS